MSKEWGIKTGTIYFHLKELEPLIKQNHEKEYILTDLGKQVCDWFIGTRTGRVQVKKIDAYTILGAKLVNLYEQSLLLKVLVLILGLMSLLFSSQLSIVIVGSFMLPSNTMSWEEVIILNILGLLALIFTFIILMGIFERKLVNFSLNLFLYLLFANVLTYLTIVILTGISYLIPVVLTIQMWLTISVLSQIAFVSIFSTMLTVKMGIRGERSLSISLIMLYVTVIIALFFL